MASHSETAASQRQSLRQIHPRSDLEEGEDLVKRWDHWVPSCPQRHTRHPTCHFISSTGNVQKGLWTCCFLSLKCLVPGLGSYSSLRSETHRHEHAFLQTRCLLSILRSQSRCRSICGTELLEFHLLIYAVLLPFLLNATVMSKGDLSARTGIVFTPRTQHNAWHLTASQTYYWMDKWTLRWASLVAQNPPHLPMQETGFNPWVGKIPWRRAWQPTPVFLPGESRGQRSLVGCGPWGHKESDRTEWLNNELHLRLVEGSLAPGCVSRKLQRWGKGPLDSNISALFSPIPAFSWKGWETQSRLRRRPSKGQLPSDKLRRQELQRKDKGLFIIHWVLEGESV